MIGLYLHVPFCDGKCPYCDFYSLGADEELMEAYTRRMEEVVAAWGRKCGGEAGQRETVKTVYFGGGTPNLLGAGRLGGLLEAVSRAFHLPGGVEVTAEVNPTHVDGSFFRELKRAGFNRISMGLQSADENELRILGRKHTPIDVRRAVEAARSGGIDNLSLDLMLGLPPVSSGEGRGPLVRSIEFAAGLGVEHISSYILKVEENTPFAAQGVQTPEDDEAAGQYLFCVEELEKRGFSQYEISNFAKPGKESRHNLVYWHGEEYLGLGPGAHSFYDGKRFYYPRDLQAFLKGGKPLPDGEGGSFAEYAMLNLRLTEGLRREACAARFGPAGEKDFDAVRGNAKKCPPGLVRADGEAISFTPQGFLVSNALLLKLLPEIP